MLAMEVTAIGGPEVLRAVERARPIAGPGQVVIAIKAIGVNFVDLQHRAGAPVSDHSDAFHPRDRSVRRGQTRSATASSEFKVGDRVAFAGPMPGTYAEYAALDAGLVVPVPDAMERQRRGGDPDAGADSPLSHP